MMPVAVFFRTLLAPTRAAHVPRRLTFTTKGKPDAEALCGHASVDFELLFGVPDEFCRRCSELDTEWSGDYRAIENPTPVAEAPTDPAARALEAAAVVFYRALLVGDAAAERRALHAAALAYAEAAGKGVRP